MGAVNRVSAYRQCTMTLSATRNSALFFSFPKPSLQPKISTPVSQQPRSCSLISPASDNLYTLSLCSSMRRQNARKAPKAPIRHLLNPTPRFAACLSAHRQEFACTCVPPSLSLLPKLVCNANVRLRTAPSRRPIPPPRSCHSLFLKQGRPPPSRAQL